MIINHNMASLNTYRQLSTNNVNSANSLAKLSSGLRINKAGDDAAGLAISEKMRGQIRGLDQASRNAQDGISMIQTAEGGLNETHNILQRMRELAVQAGNDTNAAGDRVEIQKEINQLTSEINRIGNTTEFNTQKLSNATAGTTTVEAQGVYSATFNSTTTSISIDGQSFTYGTGAGQFDTEDELKGLIDGNATLSAKYTVTTAAGAIALTQIEGSDTGAVVTGALAFTTTTAGASAKSSFSMQIGANESQTMTLDFADMRADALGITGTAGVTGFTSSNTVTDGTNNTKTEAALDVSNSTNAGSAVTKIQAAIDKVSAERSKLGAYQNRLDHTIANLGTSSENLTAAESRVRDVDMAKEMMNFQKNNILSQAAQAMLAQANQQPQGVLQLLR